jgi:hypothetical protein
MPLVVLVGTDSAAVPPLTVLLAPPPPISHPSHPVTRSVMTVRCSAAAAVGNDIKIEIVEARTTRYLSESFIVPP